MGALAWMILAWVILASVALAWVILAWAFLTYGLLAPRQILFDYPCLILFDYTDLPADPAYPGASLRFRFE